MIIDKADGGMRDITPGYRYAGLLEYYSFLYVKAYILWEFLLVSLDKMGYELLFVAMHKVMFN